MDTQQKYEDFNFYKHKNSLNFYLLDYLSKIQNDFLRFNFPDEVPAICFQ